MPRRSRPAALLALAGVTLVLVVSAAGSGPASAAPLADIDARLAAAQVRVQQMSAEVVRVTAELTNGTREWERGTQELTVAQRDVASASRDAEQASRVADRKRSTLDTIAAANYRQPPAAAPGLRALSAPGAAVFDVLSADAYLARVRVSQGEAVAEATDASRSATLASENAFRLRAAATEQERRLAAQLAALQALAQRTSEDLLRASSDVERLQAERAAELARLEAERLAALAAAEKARQQRAAAAAAAAAKVAAASARITGGPAAGCTGQPVSGYANGTLPTSALCPLSYAPDHRLRADAAAAFNRMTEAARGSRGAPLCVTDSYRSYAQQVDVYGRKPGLAAVPGTSNHGWGVAVDFCGGVESFGSAAYQWMTANAPKYGWVHPAWAEASGSRPEAWHWEFVG